TAQAGVKVYLDASGTNTGDATGDTYSFINIVRGSEHNDTLHVGKLNFNNDIFDDPGQLEGGGGDDKLYGSDTHFDTLDGGAGADLLDGGLGEHDWASYGSSQE